MAKLLANLKDNEEIFKIPGTSFQFSAVRADKLEASEFTLVTIVIDITGSVKNFATDLKKMLISIVEACQKHPRKENLMLRVVLFNYDLYEVHSFKPILDINVNDYKDFDCNGTTALFDATYYSIEATQVYADSLNNVDIDCNAAIFIITDGVDNASSYNPSNIKNSVNKIIKDEKLQSFLSVLIGINSNEYKQYLEHFKNTSELSQYVDVADATPSNLAKLGGFISQSISSSSQALATKTASVPISIQF